MRSRVVAGLAVVSATALFISCSDGPSGTNSLTFRPGSANVELNTVEGLIEALFPNGTETAALQRWAATEKAIEDGNAKVANRHMTQLAGFVLRNEAQERLDDPDGSDPMSVRDGVLRLINLMFGAVNPGAEQPPTNVSGDYVIAVVDGSHQTVVTPQRYAGVEFPAGAAAEPFILVVRETHSDYGECEGPLNTELCQYPRFYDFTPYPYTRLTRQATFGVCVVVDGPRKPSKEIDDRLRLAHDAPLDAPRDGYQYVPGPRGSRGIEILPYVQTKFLECHQKIRGEVIGFLENLLLPRKAYAIDLGGGGQSDAFSNFNVVDPGSPQVDLPPEVIVIAPPGKPPKHRDR